MQRINFRLLCLFLLSALTASAQNDAAKFKDRISPRFGVNIAPEANFSQIKNDLFSGSSFIERSVVGMTGFSAGLNCKFRIKENLYLVSGVAYGLKRGRFNITGLNYEFDYDTATRSFIDGTDFTNYWFMEIQMPLTLQYISKNQRFSVSGGLEGAYLFKNISESWTEYTNGIITNKVVDYNGTMLNFAPIFSCGYNVLRKERVLFSVEPTLKWYLKNYRVHNYYEFNTVTMGLKATWWF
ncbi:MAG: outer membrane beta-barrel protein [Chitinophagaceae bacterium]|jgi:hypothetical protein